MRGFLVMLWLIFASLALQAQPRYWVYFTDKCEAVVELDAGVCTQYLQSLNQVGIQPHIESKWLNAISCTLTSRQRSELNAMPFVASVEPVLELETTSSSRELEARALLQVEAESFLEAGLSGKGVTVGIIDGGFLSADQDQSLISIFEDNRVLHTRDYISNNSNFFDQSESSLDWHGTRVWTFIGGSDPESIIGLATGASYVLARSEHGDKEFRGEEDYWIAALEWMDSLGVRLVNSSLGYSNAFDNPEENYKPSQMDGKTTAISRAAQIAVEEKNMILVISAGNDGNDKTWEVVTTPGDAPGVITVGSTQYSSWLKAGFSAIGPDYIDFLKPNVTVYSSSGTSFSAPVITGMIACMLEMNPNLTAQEVTTILSKAGHLYPYPNNYLGYGVPDAGKILELMENPKTRMDFGPRLKVRDNFFSIDSEVEGERVTVFHKSDKITLIRQAVVLEEDGKMIIHRPREANYTTLYLRDKVIELEWK